MEKTYILQLNHKIEFTPTNQDIQKEILIQYTIVTTFTKKLILFKLLNNVFK